VFNEYVDVKVHLTVAEARQVAESLLKVAAVVEGRRCPTGGSPIVGPPGSRARLLLISVQLISQATGVCVWVHRAAYSAGVR
jgi:hypothetical protein